MKDFVLNRNIKNVTNIHQPITKEPYPFQLDAFKALDKVKANNPKGFATVLVLPTGAGKTYTAVNWVIKNYIDKGVKVLWLAHRSELLRQAAETFFYNTNENTLPNRKTYSSYVISGEFGRSCNINLENRDLIIASTQSVNSGNNIKYYLDWIKKGSFLRKNRKLLIVIDEAHHTPARSYRRIINEFKKAVPNLDLLGLTATPERTAKNEQGSLKKIYNTGTGIAYSIYTNTLIKMGILSTPFHKKVYTSIDASSLFSDSDIEKIKKKNNDLTSLGDETLKRITENKDRNKIIVDEYVNNQQKYGKTIVFAINVFNAIELNAIFKSRGIKSDYVVSGILSKDGTHSVSEKRNPEVLKKFKQGDIDVLINVNIVTEGTDIPNVQTVFLARPTMSRILMTQMVGRGLRGTAAGGTAETYLVYFIDDWKDKITFVNPKELLDGEDVAYNLSSVNRKKITRFVEVEEIEKYAVNTYNSLPQITIMHNNIIPVAIVSCSYLSVDSYGNEEPFNCDIMVYNESKKAFDIALSKIPQWFNADYYSEQEIKSKCRDLYFYCCDNLERVPVNFSSSVIYDMVKSYLDNEILPEVNYLKERVDLLDISKTVFENTNSFDEYELEIEQNWKNNQSIRKWFDHDFYVVMMKVYYQRFENKEYNAQKVELLPKEKMSLDQIKEYYPEYYNELCDYVFQKAYNEEDGCYYSAQIDEVTGEYPHKKYKKFFEIDHINPMSEGGLSVKENLQLLTVKQNRIKGNKI